MTTLSKDAQEYAALVAKRKSLEGELEKAKEDLVKKEKALLDRFGDEGVEGVKIKVGNEKFTLYPRRELWASGVPGMEKALFRLLRRNDYGDLVKENVNTMSLSALVREFDQAGKKLPASWTKVIKVTEKFKIGVRKST